MLPLRRLCSLSLVLALSGASAVAWARPQPPKAPPPQAAPPQAQQRSVPAQQHRNRSEQQALSEAVRRAERNGQVLSAEQVQYDGRDVNRVKIVDNQGRVRVYWDDPAAKPPQGQEQQGDKGRRGAKPPSGGRTRSDDDGDPTL
jgi:hypothetical protein